ncbi:hypothetical protein [Halodesulfovibrio sp.]|uniref:hypothetical protein n=1 Tax=Halodesulfovibrio sp. TaxID=1912772 RepID=UPI00359FCC03
MQAPRYIGRLTLHFDALERTLLIAIWLQGTDNTANCGQGEQGTTFSTTTGGGHGFGHGIADGNGLMHGSGRTHGAGCGHGTGCGQGTAFTHG